MTETRLVAVLLFEGVNALDVAGPLEAFSAARRKNGSPAYRVVTWSLGPQVVRSESGLKLCADQAAPENAGADVLIVPGGAGVRAPETLRELAVWLRRNGDRFDRIASVCTGAYAIAESGLADGRVLTTHWAHAVDLTRRYPKVRVGADTLSARDGRIFSSGGVTAGIDLALDLIEADCGAKAAMAVARELVVFLRRTGSQAQFSEPLKLQALANDNLAEVCLWAANNLSADLSVEALASKAGISPRQFSRRFQASFGAAPASYVKRVRLGAACSALTEGRASIEQIAHSVGFGSVDGFRRAFERQFHIGPGEYRRRFAEDRPSNTRAPA